MIQVNPPALMSDQRAVPLFPPVQPVTAAFAGVTAIKERVLAAKIPAKLEIFFMVGKGASREQKSFAQPVLHILRSAATLRHIRVVECSKSPIG